MSESGSDREGGSIQEGNGIDLSDSDDPDYQFTAEQELAALIAAASEVHMHPHPHVLYLLASLACSPLGYFDCRRAATTRMVLRLMPLRCGMRVLLHMT